MRKCCYDHRTQSVQWVNAVMTVAPKVYNAYYAVMTIAPKVYNALMLLYPSLTPKVYNR